VRLPPTPPAEATYRYQRSPPKRGWGVVKSALLRVEAPFPGITACDFRDPYPITYPSTIGVSGESFSIRVITEGVAPNHCVRVVATSESPTALSGQSEGINAHFRDEKEPPDTLTVRLIMRPSS
jgi:hypothetical protein